MAEHDQNRKQEKEKCHCGFVSFFVVSIESLDGNVLDHHGNKKQNIE
jgi:hypothetical protein